MKQSIYYETGSVLSDCQGLPTSDEKLELFIVEVDPPKLFSHYLALSLSAPSIHIYTHTHQNKQTKTSITLSSLTNQIKESYGYF